MSPNKGREVRRDERDLYKAPYPQRRKTGNKVKEHHERNTGMEKIFCMHWRHPRSQLQQFHEVPSRISKGKKDSYSDTAYRTAELQRYGKNSKRLRAKEFIIAELKSDFLAAVLDKRGQQSNAFKLLREHDLENLSELTCYLYVWTKQRHLWTHKISEGLCPVHFKWKKKNYWRRRYLPSDPLDPPPNRRLPERWHVMQETWWPRMIEDGKEM